MNAMPLREDVFYPESDGAPMAETELHSEVAIDLLKGLRTYFADAPDVHVGGNLFLYYEQGNPRAVVSPDVFVVRGLDKAFRNTYKLWVESRVPCLVIEVTSIHTREEDLGRKKSCYELLGIDDYFLFDPTEDYLRPSLQGLTLLDGRYRPLDPGEDGSLLSRATGLRLRREGWNLRLLDAATGERVRWTSEEVEDRKRAEARLAAVEEELARLKRELRRRDPD